MKQDKSNSPRYGYELIASDLLHRITCSEWAIGEKIPSIDRLVKMYPYSRMTIVKGIEHLVSQGYLRTKRGSGAYVEANKKLMRVALLFSDDLMNPQDTPFASLVLQAARKFFAARQFQIEIFIDKSDPQDLENSSLLNAIAREHFDGLITIGSNVPSTLLRTERWAKNRIPHVDISSLTSSPVRVYEDRDAMTEIALKYIKGQGKSSIGFIGCGRSETAHLIKTAGDLGLRADYEWTTPYKTGSSFESFGFQAASELLAKKTVPEAIFVLDDVIAKGVAQALLSLRAKNGNDILFVSHANKGSNIFYPVAPIKIEFDPAELIDKAGSLLLNKLNGYETIDIVQVQPSLLEFAHE